ncbi:hypothetical protein ACL02S_22885 [Nocardia sp. 004]|uniref:hypothetical protein n=1 Tax=Nocardia sp. 004 TaxID=3385978 RepID=UPI0039A1723A
MTGDERPIIPRFEIGSASAGLNWAAAYEVVCEDIQATLALVSEKLAHASGDRAENLRGFQRQLVSCQRELLPTDTAAITAAHSLCDRIRTSLGRSV